MANFDGSIAQVNVQFPIETVIEPVSGENYTKALIFIPLGKAEEYLPTTESPAAGQKIELDSSNYGKLTGGLLKTWLVPFFTSAQAAKIAVAIYDVDAEEVTAKAPLDKVYEAYKYYAYFKFGLAPSNDYNALQTQLAQLCKADPLYSQLWVGTSDPQVLTKESSLVSALKGVAADARVVYNPDDTINAALAQLGATLAQSNATGTPVGNDNKQQHERTGNLCYKPVVHCKRRKRNTAGCEGGSVQGDCCGTADQSEERGKNNAAYAGNKIKRKKWSFQKHLN